MNDFLRDKDSDDELVDRMPAPERSLCRTFGHLRIESAFADRLFILYRPTGLNALKQHREPHIVTTLLLSDFMCDSKAGSSAKVVDTANGMTMAIGHVPRRVFDYELFMAIPTRMYLRWEARVA